MPVSAKQWYVSFLEKDTRNILEKILYCFLYVLSFVYGAVVLIRSLLYDKKILRSFSPGSKVISIGNICWSGSGKTSLSLWLYKRLSASGNVAILRRGYGSDEGKLISETTKDVFSSLDRVGLAKDLQSSFDYFILDDGFQYRKLTADANIVIMGAREFKRKHRLIPAYFFREPLSSLKRADILLLNYKEEFSDVSQVKKSIKNIAPDLKIYTCTYKPRRFFDLDDREITVEALKRHKLAGLSAIGYPQGFFNKLKELDLELTEKVIYPDHYELSAQQLKEVEQRLISKGVEYLIISHKDKYHLPMYQTKLHIIVMDVEIDIDEQEEFLEDVRGFLGK